MGYSHGEKLQSSCKGSGEGRDCWRWDGDKTALRYHSQSPPSYLPALEKKGERQLVCLMLRLLR